MSVQLNPYLNFRGETRDAMEFYRDVFGGDLQLTTFGQFASAGDQQDPAEADKVMHASLVASDDLVLMAADAPQSVQASPNGTLSLSGDDADRLRSYWRGLSDGGAVTMPLEKQAWGDEFGMLVDRFGVPWMININAAH